MATTRRAVISVCCVLMFGLGACSSGTTGTSGAPPSAGTPETPVAQPSAAATEAATAPAAITPTDSPGDTTPPGLSKWDAFKARAVEFAKVGPIISDLLQKGAAGDASAAKQIAQTLKPASDDLAAWLDANPPDECYRASWEPLREGALLTSAGAAAYLADDATAGSENLMAGGSKIVEAGSTISDSGDRCRAAG